MDELTEKLTKLNIDTHKRPKLPKGRRSAYGFFVQHFHSDLKSKDQTLPTLGQLSKICSKKWKEIPKREKEKYEKKAKEDVKRYETEMAQYEQQKVLYDKMVDQIHDKGMIKELAASQKLSIGFDGMKHKSKGKDDSNKRVLNKNGKNSKIDKNDKIDKNEKNDKNEKKGKNSKTVNSNENASKGIFEKLNFDESDNEEEVYKGNHESQATTSQHRKFENIHEGDIEEDLEDESIAEDVNGADEEGDDEEEEDEEVDDETGDESEGSGAERSGESSSDFD